MKGADLPVAVHSGDGTSEVGVERPMEPDGPETKTAPSSLAELEALYSSLSAADRDQLLLMSG